MKVEVQENMPKTLLAKSYGGFSSKIKNIKYVHLKQYDLGRGAKVRLKKETSPFTRYAGWGLQAVTHIPQGFVLGNFVLKNEAKEPEEGTYNIRKPNGKYLVMEQDSLMNRINTIAHPKARHRCNCAIGNLTNDGKVSVKTTKHIPAGTMLWVKYGNAQHYWEIQYYILQKRLRVLTPLAKKENSCRGCRKRHLTLYVCESCPVAICSSCLSQSEKYILKKTYFFCKDCMVDPPKFMSRFSGKTAPIPYTGTAEEKEERWLRNTQHKTLHGGVYCTTFCGGFDLDVTWKCDRERVISLFKRANMKEVEFLNLKGSDLNDNCPWDVPVVEALIGMLERGKSRVYGINLGEICFTQNALEYLHNQLRRTWIGWIYIEKRYNVLPKHCFEDTKPWSNISKNRKERPVWHKAGKIAPWYDEEKRKFFDQNETMGKCLWSCLSSKYFGNPNP
jgi:hypothetical protein